MLGVYVKPRTFISTPVEVAQGPTASEINSTSFNGAASGARSFFLNTRSSGALFHMVNLSDRYIPGSSNRCSNIPTTAPPNTHVNHVLFRCLLNYSCEV